MNLLELPVLFYVACLSMYVTGKVDAVGRGHRLALRGPARGCTR